MTENELKGFTPTERKILAVLADGERHGRAELYGPLDIVEFEGKYDEGHIGTHIFNIRGKLRPMGKYVITEYHMRRYYYRLVNLVKPIMPIR